MDTSRERLRRKIADLLEKWQQTGLPSRAGFEAAAQDLLAWRRAERLTGLWQERPLMMTATLDDGWGHGLELIHLFAEAAGIRTRSLGLLQTPANIVAACQKDAPDFLGLTVLQFDSEEALTAICRNLPDRTRTIVGGPIFQADPELAERAGVDFVARNAASFWRHLLDLAGE